MSTTQKNVIRAAQLISLPEVYLRLKNLLDEPDFAMAEVVVAISRDPAVTARLLRMANSSFYGFTTKVETVSRAVILIGARQVHDLLSATLVAETFKGMTCDVMDMHRFWRRSVYCAIATRQLAGLCSDLSRERFFIAGLLHDIGHLVMYQVIPELSQQALLLAKESGEPVSRKERELLGFDHAIINAELMHQWSLPESLQEMMQFHLEPEKAQNYPRETALVYLGALVAAANDEDRGWEEPLFGVQAFVWEVTGLTPEICMSLEEASEQQVEETIHLIF